MLSVGLRLIYSGKKQLVLMKKLCFVDGLWFLPPDFHNITLLPKKQLVFQNTLCFSFIINWPQQKLPLNRNRCILADNAPKFSIQNQHQTRKNENGTGCIKYMPINSIII